eukprot:6074785-Prymnesium_polylepis.1
MCEGCWAGRHRAAQWPLEARSRPLTARRLRLRLTFSRTGHETNSRGLAMVADGAVRERARPREVVR